MGKNDRNLGAGTGTKPRWLNDQSLCSARRRDSEPGWSSPSRTSYAGRLRTAPSDPLVAASAPPLTRRGATSALRRIGRASTSWKFLQMESRWAQREIQLWLNEKEEMSMARKVIEFHKGALRLRGREEVK